MLIGKARIRESGLKKFDATLKGTLYERIDALAARHDITTAMQEFKQVLQAGFAFA
jgi:hypothetical protein